MSEDLKEFVFIICVETVTGPAFVRTSIQAETPEKAQLAGEDWTKRFLRSAKPEREIRHLINNYLVDVADLVDEAESATRILHQFCDSCGTRDRACRCGDDS